MRRSCNRGARRRRRGRVRRRRRRKRCRFFGQRSKGS
jgi:hypothetical protein